MRNDLVGQVLVFVVELDRNWRQTSVEDRLWSWDGRVGFRVVVDREAMQSAHRDRLQVAEAN